MIQFSRDTDEDHEDLASFVELIRFLTLYLNFETTKTIEKSAKQLILNPDRDTRGFVNFVKNEIDQKLIKDREDIAVVTEKLITDYQNQMRNSENHTMHCSVYPNPSRGTSSETFDSVRIEAGLKLVEGLQGMIPEPKRSNFKHNVLQVTKVFLEDYLNELKEELQGYIDGREDEIKRRSNALLNDFRNDLFVLSRQLRVVSKINLMIERLETENVPQREKEDIYIIAEPIKNILKKTKVTVGKAEIISELISRVNSLAEEGTSWKFRKSAKELRKTVSYMFKDYSKHVWK